MKKSKVILSVLLMAAAISFTACSNASSGSSDPSTPAPATTPSTPSSGGGSGSGSGNQTPPSNYIGSKAPTEAKVVGDIVFTDGSATPYTSLNSLSNTQKQAAIAIIFYVGTDLNSGSDTTTVRTLGLGLKFSSTDMKWATDNAAAIIKVNSIVCNSSTVNNVQSFDGDKNGFDNLEQMAASISDTADSTKYPAFYFAKNYKNITGNNVSGTAFENGWYLPSIAELYQIYVNGKGTNKVFDFNSVLNALNNTQNGDNFGSYNFWSSSQSPSDPYVFLLKVSDGTIQSNIEKFTATNNRVCAIRDFTPYTVTVNTTGGGNVTANKNSATPGETVTLTVTDTTEDNDYDITTFTMNGTALPGLSSNKTVTFTMPATNVTIATTFVGRYVGSKRPSRAKEVGDIVFNDGSSMPYSTFTGLTSTEKDSKKTRAIALIFYKGNGLNKDNDTSIRTLGVGLKHQNNLQWCKHNSNSYDSEAAKGAYTNITTIQCVPAGEKGNYTSFTGDKYGKDNFEQIAAFLGTNNDTTTSGNYPVFEFAKDYKSKLIGSETTRRISDTSEFKDGWYIPSIAELYQIWENGNGTRKVFDINEASIALGGDTFAPQYPYFWSSSQYNTTDNAVYEIRFSDGNIEYRFKFWSENMIYACCIREF